MIDVITQLYNKETNNRDLSLVSQISPGICLLKKWPITIITWHETVEEVSYHNHCAVIICIMDYYNKILNPVYLCSIVNLNAFDIVLLFFLN